MNLSTDQLPPQNLNAEKSLLGSMFFAGEAVDIAMQELTATDFYSDANAKLFIAMAKLHEAGDKIDAVTVAAEIERDGLLEDIGGLPYILQVAETVPHAYHADSYAKLVREASQRRQAVQCGFEIVRKAHDPGCDVGEAVAECEATLHGLMERSLDGSESVSIHSLLLDAFDHIGAAKTRGVPTGFRALDAWTFGWQPGQLTIVAARPSVGKTALACNFAVSAAGAGHPVMYFSLEQGRLQLSERLLALQSGVDGNRLKSGDISEAHRHLILQGSSELSKLPIYIDDTATRTVSQVAARCRLMKRRGGLGLVIIDYLQLLTAEDSRIPREQQVATISRSCANLSRDLDVPVMVLAQLNRAFEARADKRPRLSDLRESGSLEQDARMVLLIDRPFTYQYPNAAIGETVVNLAKNSEGQTGKLPLEMQVGTGRFEETQNADDGFGDEDFMEQDLALFPNSN